MVSVNAILTELAEGRSKMETCRPTRAGERDAHLTVAAWAFDRRSPAGGRALIVIKACSHVASEARSPEELPGPIALPLMQILLS
jgi:hypothetical protein